MKKYVLVGLLAISMFMSCQSEKQLTDYVNPFLGTATLWNKEDLGYERHLKVRTWGAEVFPGMRWYS